MDDYTINKELKKIKLILTTNGYVAKTAHGYKTSKGYIWFFTKSHYVAITRINHNFNTYTIYNIEKAAPIIRCTKLKELSDHLKDHHEY